MRNYSDMMARAHHDKDEEQVMRAVFCPFLRHCCKAQLANNYRNKFLWHQSRYFCIDICEGGGVFKAMAAYLHTIGRTRKYSRKQVSFSEKFMQIYLKHKEVSVYRILILTCFIPLSCIVARRLGVVHCLYYELQT